MNKNDVTRKLTVREFFKRFPDEESCLEHVMTVPYGHRHTCGKCGVVDATFHRLENRKAYACAHCGDNLYPCAGTIFEKTRTPLQIWFYAIFLFISTRHGVSGMELHRQLGVTRKCAYAKVDDKGRNHHVNGVENFWKMFKSSVRSTHVQNSKRHADKYLNEFAFRQNHREMGNAMFDVLIAAV